MVRKLFILSLACLHNPPCLSEKLQTNIIGNQNVASICIYRAAHGKMFLPLNPQVSITCTQTDFFYVSVNSGQFLEFLFDNIVYENTIDISIRFFSYTFRPSGASVRVYIMLL